MNDLLQAAAESAQTLIAAAFGRAVPENPQGARPDGTVTLPRRAEHGDLTANHTLIGAAALGLPPAELARRLARNMDLDGSCFAAVDAAGAGFLNFMLSDAWYGAVLDEAARLATPPTALAAPKTAADELRLFPRTDVVPVEELSRRGDMANGVYCVRYAYARMGAVIENYAAAARPVYPAETADAARLSHPAERALIKLVAALPGECACAGERRDAAALCGYALRLADGFYAVYALHGYFSADEHTLAQRLRLLAAARRALGYALDRAGVNKNMI